LGKISNTQKKKNHMPSFQCCDLNSVAIGNSSNHLVLIIQFSDKLTPNFNSKIPVPLEVSRLNTKNLCSWHVCSH